MKNKTKVKCVCFMGFSLSLLMLLILAVFHFFLTGEESTFTPRDYGQLEFSEENFKVMQEIAQQLNEGSIEIQKGILKLIRTSVICLVFILLFFIYLYIKAGRFYKNQT